MAVVRPQRPSAPPKGRPRTRIGVALAILIGVSACTESGSERRGVIRLVDEVVRAEVHSPLLASEVRTPEPIASRVIWRQRASREPGRFLLAADPSSDYRLARADARCARLVALELSADGDPLREHRAWGQDNEGAPFFTTPRTRALDVSVGADPGGDCGPAASEVRLERLTLSYVQELALLAAEAPLADGGAQLGIAKHGQFLPLAEAETVAPPFDENFDVRDALFAPAPSELGFELVIPEHARLRFSYALARRSRTGDSVTFEIRAVGPDGVEQQLFDETLTLDPEGRSWHWHDAQVDLSAFAKRHIRLTLSTRATSARGYALWGDPTIDAPRQPSDPPNVILIAVDTLRADRLSSSDHPAATTPRIDGLASDGIRFDQAISASSWTRPAFASIFTGLTPPRHGVTRRFTPLRADVVTLAEHLRAGGWITQAILYKPFLYDDGHHQGFERYFNVPRAKRLADENLAKAVTWLERNGERRFFLFVHFDDPHQPITQPTDFVDPEDRSALATLGLRLPLFVDDDAVFSWAETDRGVRTRCAACDRDREGTRRLARHLYDGEVRYVDDRVGKLLDVLRERGLYDDALIAFVSDHGEMLWAHDEVYAHKSSGTVFDDLVRVPLIVKPPRRLGLPVGIRVARQVRSFDLMPTLLELAGVPTQDLDLEARSLVPLLRPNAPAEPEPRVAISESVRSLGIRRDGWKYLYRTSPAWEGLFDLRADPGETHDVAGVRSDVLTDLRLRLIRFLVPRHSGRFIAVTGDFEAPIHIRIRWDRAVTWGEAGHFGLARVADAAAHTVAFEGMPHGNLALLAHFQIASDARVRVELRPVGDGAPLGEPGVAVATPDALARATRAPAPAVHLLSGGAPRRVDATPSTVDAQKLEALRVLGYLE